jgi:hypothetical protein
MAAITYYAAQPTQVRANEMSPSTDCGPLIRQYFYYLTPIEIAVADLIMWGFMPKGCRFFGGKVKISAGGHAATANIGSYTVVAAPVVISAAKYGTLSDMTSLSAQTFGETVAKSYGVLETTNVYIGIVTGAQAFHIAQTMTGYYDYLM